MRALAGPLTLEYALVQQLTQEQILAPSGKESAGSLAIHRSGSFTAGLSNQVSGAVSQYAGTSGGSSSVTSIVGGPLSGLATGGSFSALATQGGAIELGSTVGSMASIGTDGSFTGRGEERVLCCGWGSVIWWVGECFLVDGGVFCCGWGSVAGDYNTLHKLVGLHETVGSVRPCSTLSHMISYFGYL
jgi:hypothetical protein